MGAIQIEPKDLTGFLVRASLIESAKKRLLQQQEELKNLENESSEYWRELSKKYNLTKDDKYKIDQDNCSLIKV